MATAVSICSNALLKIGAGPISSLTESTDQARICANLYQPTVDHVMRRHTWNCCVKRVQLAPTVDAPAFDYSASFNLPSDWIRTLQVGEAGNEIDYVTEGRRILADTTVLPLRYVARVTEDQWDAAMVEIVTLAMAVAIAYPITKSASLMQALEQKLEYQFRIARAVDGQDDPAQTFGDFPSYTTRFG